MKIRNLPIGIQDFEKLRTSNFVYVDKTQYVYDLVKTEVPYFLSRPRRFGKSLLLSTIEAYFLGKKELFEGLAIYDEEAKSENPWQVYPVLKFSLAAGEFTSSEGLRSQLEGTLSDFEEKYDLPTVTDTLPRKFAISALPFLRESRNSARFRFSAI